MAQCSLWNANINTLFALDDKLKETTNTRPPDWNFLMWLPHRCSPSHGFPSYTWPHFLSSWLQVYKSHSVKFSMKSTRWKKITQTRLPVYGLVAASHFSVSVGEKGEPWANTKGPSCSILAPNSSLQEPPTFPVTGESCHQAPSWIPLRLERQVPLHGSLCVRAVTKDTSLQPFSLSSDVIDSTPRDWGLGSFSQAGHASIIKLPGFNFQPLPNCLLRHVESQTHSFFPPFPGDWSSLMIVLWGGERDADQEKLESDEREKL